MARSGKAGLGHAEGRKRKGMGSQRQGRRRKVSKASSRISNEGKAEELVLV